MTHQTPSAPRNPDYESAVRDSAARQTILTTLGATVERVAPGEVVIAAPPDDRFMQQDGYTHAGVITTILDSACGYAALTLMPPGSRVLSVEFKVNLLAPAIGERFVATARVARSGRTLTVVSAEAVAVRGDERVPIALMQATMFRLDAGPG